MFQGEVWEMLTLLKRVLRFLHWGPSSFSQPNVGSFTILGKLVWGSWWKTGVFPASGWGFQSTICYDVENEFPDPQVYPNGSNPQRNTLKLHEGTALSALVINCVPVLIMFRIVGTVSALWISIVTHVIHCHLNRLFKSMSKTNIYMESKINYTL